MRLINHIRKGLRRFCRGSEGGLSVEAVVILPLMMLGFGLTATYYDAFRARTANVKAAYTVGDLLSRQKEPIDQEFIDGLADIFDYLTDDTDQSWIRVSVVSWSVSQDKLLLKWSKVSGTSPDPVLTQEDIENMADRIPVMADGDTIILVETHMDYSSVLEQLPFYTKWLNSGIEFDNFVVTSPRFVPKLEFTS
ncbi:hypothetical protein PSA7680_02912 [Pseudoruegeria aquimaris]|uniref:TadE-like protein n=1 Tax=Pseudoruegeria aquimaris TaxID=393663 RepID=A0A1Y5T7P7_9RHOB|nr:hypothetical protein [Pseudoruegeria aquimaris]SLN55857.1 hypothetical protein PSA7680_02912 [Pseudoruegeria aquimaris]